MPVDLGLTCAFDVPVHASMSCCALDLDGVRVEWVEVTAATPGQSTLVYFPTGRDVSRCRSWARTLAATTGGRVLTVGYCGLDPDGSCHTAVGNGVTAYAWLLGEGLDLDTTAFVGDADGGWLPQAILLAIRHLGLPLPATVRPAGALAGGHDPLPLKASPSPVG